MKKIFGSALLAALMLVGCSKEIDNGANGGVSNSSAVQFIIKNNKGSLVTYAIAEDDQWTVGSYDVYAFSGGALVGSGKMTQGTDYTLSTVGGTTTITATPAWLGTVAGETVNFYFVGNDATSMGGAHIPASVPTSEATFKELLTNAVPDTDADGYYDNIKPLLLFSAVVPDVALTGKVQKDVTLTRRDARFDIKNELYQSFQIDEIYISNANIQANIFGTATGVNTPAQGSHETVTGPAQGDYDATSFLATSVFHIYPTTLGKAADGNTEIMIKATMGGKSENFTIKNEMEILPNHRYILVLDPLSLTFTVTVADYEEGGEIETEVGGEASFSSFAITPTVATAGNWNAATQVYKFDDNDADVLSITVESQYGSAYKTTYVLGDETAISNYQVTRTRTTTYSGFKVKDVYTVKVPQNSDAGKAFSIKLDIYSPGGEAKETIIFSKGSLGSAEDVVGGNAELGQVIKDIIEANGGDGDNVRPEDLEGITIINVGGADGPSSLEGIENLPNLNSVLAINNSNLTEVDFSGVNNLETINLQDAQNLTSLNIGNQPNLKYLTVTSEHITSLDVSGFPLLENINIRYSGITNIDLSHNPELLLAYFHATKLKTLDLSHNPKVTEVRTFDSSIETMVLADETPALKQLQLQRSAMQNLHIKYAPVLENINIRETPIEELDITGCPALKILTAGNNGNTFVCENLKINMSAPENASLTNINMKGVKNIEFKVSSTFPLTNPAQQFTVGMQFTVGATAVFTDGTNTETYTF